MAERDTQRIARDTLAEPHIRGRRISVRQVYALVEERGVDPETVADRYDLDVADVYHALAYYHDHPREMNDVERVRADAIDSFRESVDRPDGVDPDTARDERVGISPRREHRSKDCLLFKQGRTDAEHVRDALWLGADDESDILPYALEHDLIVITSDVTDFGSLPDDAHAGLVLLYDDTMPAYRVASALISMVDAYSDRDSFPEREELDSWA